MNRLDELCQRFENEWLGGCRPGVEDYLAKASAEEREELLGELLLIEWAYRLKAKDSFYKDEYARRFQPWGDAVAQAWKRWKQNDTSSWSTVPPTGPTTPPSEPAFAGYEQVAEIGRGGMGQVFRAFNPRLKCRVALKLLRADTASPARLARFRTEAEALARLRHPHIVAVHDFQDQGDQPMLVMEYADGGSLEQRLQSRDLPTPQ